MEPVLRTLFVHSPGTRLVLEGSSIKALREGEPTRRLPLHAIDTLVVLGGVDVSTPLLLHCAENQRVVAFLSRYGKPRAVVEASLSGRSQLRRLQYAAHADTERRAELAGNVVAGKIGQMAWGLRQWARSADAETSSQLREVSMRLDSSAMTTQGLSRQELLGVEGEASRRYFRAFGTTLKGASWAGRRRRPVTDPVNALLSWCYGMTHIAMQGAVAVAGLDAGTGFLHGDRANQPSLVLDLMEEFRPAADALAAKLLNTRQLQPKHFDVSVSGAVELNTAGREILFDAWHQHRSRLVRVQGRSLKVPNAFIPIIQAHNFANALRNNAPYVAHVRTVQ
jgi:CRISPR-associated protein Cas1